MDLNSQFSAVPAQALWVATPASEVSGVGNKPFETAGRGYQLLLLALAMAAAGYVRTAVSPLQEALRVALSLTDNQMAVLQGPVIGIPVAFAAVPLGLIIDRYVRTPLLSLLIVLSLVGSLLTAFSSSFAGLLLARCLSGVAGLGILPVVFSLLADHYPPAQRGLVTTVAIIGQVIGNSAAFALGGMLLAKSGVAPEGWRWAMLWLTAPLVPILLCMLALREPPRTGLKIANPTARQVLDEFRHLRFIIVPLVIGIVMAEIAVGAIIIWASPMLSRKFNLAPDHIGSIMAIGLLVSGVLGPVVGGPLADLCQRTGGPRCTVWVLSALALFSVPAGLFAFVPGVGLASILLILSMTLLLAIVVMGMALFTIVIPNELRGLCMSGLVAAEILFALAIAPPVVSILSGAMGGLAMIGRALSTVCVAAGLIAALTFAFGTRYYPRVQTPR